MRPWCGAINNAAQHIERNLRPALKLSDFIIERYLGSLCFYSRGHQLRLMDGRRSVKKKENLSSKIPPVNFSWLHLLGDLSVWFNVELTVIGFWCLPLITLEKKKNWKNGSPIYAAEAHKVASKIKILTPRKHYKSLPYVIGDASFVCVKRMAGLLTFISIFWHIPIQLLLKSPFFLVYYFTWLMVEHAGWVFLFLYRRLPVSSWNFT